MERLFDYLDDRPGLLGLIGVLVGAAAVALVMGMFWMADSF